MRGQYVTTRREENMTHVANNDDLPYGTIAHGFEGYRYGDAGVPLFLVDSPPGGGAVRRSGAARPSLRGGLRDAGGHNATFSVGDETIEVWVPAR
jgi:hypothetical protein